MREHQQCFWIAQQQPNYSILPCSGRVPNKTNMAVSNLKGFLCNMATVNKKPINKYSPETTETSEGHMQQQRQGISSTKPKNNTSHQQQGRKEWDIYSQVCKMKQIMYIDHIGAFPIRSSQGNRYLMILCEIESNVILVEPMKNRIPGKMSKATKNSRNN